MGNFEGGYGYDAERAVPGMPPASVKIASVRSAVVLAGCARFTTRQWGNKGSEKGSVRAAAKRSEELVRWENRLRKQRKRKPRSTPGPGLSVPRLHPSEIVATQLPNYLVSQTLTVRIAL